ncbi:MAG: N-acetyltransferase [Alphaproteobacteria bacterium]|nr:MAG: N-acetyltransferase [Alphaproteobacteria bacterium]
MRADFARDFIVRPLNLAVDGPALHAIYGDEDCCRYLSRPATTSVDETVTMIQQWETRDDINWVLADHADGPALGRISVYASSKPNVWEAACMISPAARGRNLAARSLAILIDEAFDNRGVRRIVADVDPDNIPSVRVFEKLGFGYEGRLRGEWETHLGIRDSLIFGLLRDDPRPWRNWTF